jgi:hypothetical protein
MISGISILIGRSEPYLPTISMAILTAAAWRIQPTKDTIEPAAIVFFLPRRSPKNILMRVPSTAPPWKVETMPPITVLFGLLKYSIN